MVENCRGLEHAPESPAPSRRLEPPLLSARVPPRSARSHPPCTFRRALYTEAARGRASRRGLRARARSAVRVLDSTQPRSRSLPWRAGQHSTLRRGIWTMRTGCACVVGASGAQVLLGFDPGCASLRGERCKVRLLRPSRLPLSAPLSRVPSRRASRSRTPCLVVAVSFFACALRGSRSRPARCARVSWCLSLAVSSLRWQPRRAGHAVPALVLTLPASLPVRP